MTNLNNAAPQIPEYQEFLAQLEDFEVELTTDLGDFDVDQADLDNPGFKDRWKGFIDGVDGQVLLNGDYHDMIPLPIFFLIKKAFQNLNDDDGVVDGIDLSTDESNETVCDICKDIDESLYDMDNIDYFCSGFMDYVGIYADVQSTILMNALSQSLYGMTYDELITAADNSPYTDDGQAQWSLLRDQLKTIEVVTQILLPWNKKTRFSDLDQLGDYDIFSRYGDNFNDPYHLNNTSRDRTIHNNALHRNSQEGTEYITENTPDIAGIIDLIGNEYAFDDYINFLITDQEIDIGPILNDVNGKLPSTANGESIFTFYDNNNQFKFNSVYGNFQNDTLAELVDLRYYYGELEIRFSIFGSKYNMNLGDICYTFCGNGDLPTKQRKKDYNMIKERKDLVEKKANKSIDYLFIQDPTLQDISNAYCNITPTLDDDWSCDDDDIDNTNIEIDETIDRTKITSCYLTSITTQRTQEIDGFLDNQSRYAVRNHINLNLRNAPQVETVVVALFTLNDGTTVSQNLVIENGQVVN